MSISNYKRLILAGLVIAWCVVIFNFSSQSAYESSQTSEGLISAVCSFIIPEFGDFSGTERENFIESLQFIVRKSAHFTAYGILGFLSYLALYDIKIKFRYAFAVGFSFLYACSDEIHQYFVSGRSCEIRDVLIDTAGAILGSLIALGLTKLILHYRKQKNTAN